MILMRSVVVAILIGLIDPIADLVNMHTTSTRAIASRY